MTVWFDLVVAGDPRFPGGTSSATATELRAAISAGLRCAFLPFLGPVLSTPHPFNPKIRKLMDEGSVAWLAPDQAAECALLLAENPLVFANAPSHPIRLRPGAVVCVLHHALLNGFGQPQYDIGQVERTLSRLFAAQVLFAPVGPAVRAQLDRAAGSRPITVTRHDLYNLIDLAEWAPRPERPPAARPIIGRHSRPDPLKWPDIAEEIDAAYPGNGDFKVRVLGGLPPADRLPAASRNWEVYPFGSVDVGDFLRGLDFYVFYHSGEWVEAFGMAIAEALAVGVVAILDSAFEPLFEDGALYACPDEVTALVQKLAADPSAYAAQSGRARALVERKFSTRDYPARFRGLLDDAGLPVSLAGTCARPAGTNSTAGESFRAKRTRRRVLFVSSNGIGLGHVTRQLAIATRLPQPVDAAFLTLSQGCSVLADFGFPFDYAPSHQRLDVEADSWNRSFAVELANAIDYYDPGAVLFDGNVPYSGLLDVAVSMRDRYWFWCRRAMWRHSQQPDVLDRSWAFNAIFEPGEIAADVDVGPTTENRDRVVPVDPILLIDPDERLPRHEAASVLEIDPDRMTIALQLGSGSNFAYSEIRRAILSALAGASDTTVLELRSPIASADLMKPADVYGIAQRTLFPSFRFSRCFDLLITGSGYNSFHECIFGGIPAVFVPNEAPEMDDQLLRARYAETMQFARCLRAKDTFRVPAVLEEMLSSDTRVRLKERAARLKFENGAHTIAKYLEEYLYSARADGPLADLIDRI